MTTELLAAWRAMSVAEVIAVVLGVVYLVLAVRRSRWCWVAGGISSAIMIWLSAEKQLPMQAWLNVYYVVVSVYGWWRWTDAQVPQPPVTLLPLRWHLAGVAAVVIVSVLTAQYLVRETQAAWPYLDSLTTWGSLFTTWLVARVKLENWAYWFLIDAVEAYLFFEQKLYLVGLMTTATLLVIVLGHRSWWRTWRQQAGAAVAVGA
ncbi:MAG TPA: nicotinamide riboside transporter PnuC [Steroidobacteraceae bacterium]|nr:nicotinamide riboside transporter PnuC [Steroidobacteraceae bacterium]